MGPRGSLLAAAPRRSRPRCRSLRGARGGAADRIVRIRRGEGSLLAEGARMTWLLPKVSGRSATRWLRCPQADVGRCSQRPREARREPRLDLRYFAIGRKLPSGYLPGDRDERTGTEMGLIKPHGGTLRVLYLPTDEAAAYKAEATQYPSWDLSQRRAVRPQTVAERRLLAAVRLPRASRLRPRPRADAPRR